MASLIFGQLSLWLFIGLGLIGIWALWFLTSKNKHPMVPGIASGALVVLLLGAYGIGMNTSTGVRDVCILNGHLESATFEEEWTQEHYDEEDIKDSKGNVTGTRKVRNDIHHPEKFHGETSFGEVTLSRADYFGYVKRFRNETQTGNRHMDQCSRGDGRTFTTRWNGSEDTMVPWSKSESVINWVKASEHTLLRQSAKDTKVLPYPEIIEITRGPKFPRILNEGVALPKGWQEAMEWNMDVLADKVGAAKQCNPLIYITPKGVDHAEDIRAQWLGGKKNDIVIVIGVREWPKVEWAQVICWSKREEFAVTLQNYLQEANLDNGLELTKGFHRIIFSKFERRPMAEFEYLKNEIETPTWVLVTGWITVFLALAFTFLVEFSATVPVTYGYYSRFTSKPRFRIREFGK